MVDCQTCVITDQLQQKSRVFNKLHFCYSNQACNSELCTVALSYDHSNPYHDSSPPPHSPTEGEGVKPQSDVRGSGPFCCLLIYRLPPKKWSYHNTLLLILYLESQAQRWNVRPLLWTSSLNLISQPSWRDREAGCPPFQQRLSCITNMHVNNSSINGSGWAKRQNLCCV